MPRRGPDGALANEVEGYLLWQARIAEAEQRARAFVAPMDWLTTAQREEIERRYVTDTLHRARADLERIASRCASLRTEYERRYNTLRVRCVAVTLAVCAGWMAVAALLLVL
ncbi:cytochrome C oxidase subunit I [Streptomyces fodineus]|uniref:Cytochrome C oxidase subunit I n=1 Tax=Streptomyces fodineus TaxID=1904616 RepID=A0A1D7YNP7_9ACTN|nr:cytochrome C oxidase subunit I [Streptomyces fodineus]